ncbi:MULTISPECIES: acyl carrier protein [Brevibacillus]|jgi:acyl carrier protein|uniref:Putative acyl-carrier protein n=1 Tax=Brevibacillus borstelensis AK1 TaxID=1300222 RepID=M8DXN1_9BACL|nr:acyl carrier protein [Brevibacillus borstelensis]EMT51766.1 putative acyl-carrier protein [Brevibacillus borstelensis AK1]KKX56150.1 acyl-carrier protein [Brevibacillus borstelensis cifa_chp40]MBE5394386.1 acyl carrier protein [Brevibacillus borstelensis]MCC0564035.1 acyl carrier protein [Brevibacillus borstelensis]MCM3470233.1 acyl carrier protein [Brevibacillus borstelensis]
MIKQTVREKFLETYKLNVSLEEVKDDQPLFGPDSPYGLDSMDVLMFINLIKKEYDLDIGAVNTDTFKTINSIVAFIEKQKGAQLSK